MEKEVTILGYYRRERDGNEYIHYSLNGEEYLTSGVCEWNLRNRSDRIKELVKVEKIDIDKIKKNLIRFFPCSGITKYLQGE